MLDRSPFGWLRERDIDLLLCAELHAKGPITDLFAARVGAEKAIFAGAWVSHSEIEGESDLVIAWSGPDGHVVALIENKIGAAFQPDQAARYKLRAARWELEEGISSVRTLLFAPAGYAMREGAEAFDATITYEDVATAMQSSADARSTFFIAALTGGIAAFRRGWVAEPDEQISAAWQMIWRIASQEAPKLRMRQPLAKPGRSTWIYFRDAKGLAIGGKRRADVVYKAERGQADLQFPGTAAGALEHATDGLLGEGMAIVKAAKSASVRLAITSIDFRSPIEEQQYAISEGITACETLRAWFEQHGSSVLQGLRQPSS